MSQALRNLALDLLDDEHGINLQAWKSLADWLEDEGCEDIVAEVDVTEGRAILLSDVAVELRKVGCTYTDGRESGDAATDTGMYDHDDIN